MRDQVKSKLAIYDYVNVVVFLRGIVLPLILGLTSLCDASASRAPGLKTMKKSVLRRTNSEEDNRHRGGNDASK